jgi:Septum formation
MPPGNPPPPPYGQPPQGPYHQPPPGQSGPYPPPGSYGPPPKKTRWGLIIGLVAGAIALLAVAGIVFVVIVGEGTVTATDVKVGDCLAEIPNSGRVLTVQTVECDQSHAGEVYAVLTMPGGDFPGVAAIEEYQNKCEPELAAYSPDAMTDDSIQMYVLYPTAETWEQGDRAVTCVATLDPPRTGSIKG